MTTSGPEFRTRNPAAQDGAASAAAELAAPPETVEHDPPLHALMSVRLVAIVPEAPLETALRLMVSGDVRHLPVVSEGRCTGIVTEVDVLRGLAAERGPLGRAPLVVADLARPVPLLPEAAPLSAAARVMHTDGVDALLVTRRGGSGREPSTTQLVGIVTATDLVRALAR